MTEHRLVIEFSYSACDLVIIQIIAYDQLVIDYEKLCYELF
jgi:hypothetical protein